MKIYNGKKIESKNLKRNLNKSQSIDRARLASLSILPGEKLKSCPVCDSVNAKNVQIIYNYQYLACENCSVVFVVNPPMDVEEIYNSDYYNKSNSELLYDLEVIDIRINEIAKTKVEFLKDKIDNNKNSWLDIGCGAGEILKCAKDAGYEVLGIDTNKSQIKFIKDYFKIDVIESVLHKDALKVFNKKFGVISMFGVLEHFTNPNNVISIISEIQEKNDNLIIEVPNYPSVSAYTQILFPDYVNRVMHPPLHLFLFNLKSLIYIFERFSYKIEHVWYFGQDMYEFFSTVSLIVPEFSNSLLEQVFLNMNNSIQGIVDENTLSDEILIVAKKTD